MSIATRKLKPQSYLLIKLKADLTGSLVSLHGEARLECDSERQVVS